MEVRDCAGTNLIIGGGANGSFGENLSSQIAYNYVAFTVDYALFYVLYTYFFLHVFFFEFFF